MILNVERREFLGWLAAGKVYRSAGGYDFVERHSGDNRRCETMLREFTEHEPVLAVLVGSRYELTSDGRKLRRRWAATIIDTIRACSWWDTSPEMPPVVAYSSGCASVESTDAECPRHGGTECLATYRIVKEES